MSIAMCFFLRSCFQSFRRSDWAGYLPSGPHSAPVQAMVIVLALKSLSLAVCSKDMRSTDRPKCSLRSVSLTVHGWRNQGSKWNQDYVVQELTDDFLCSATVSISS